MKKGHKATHESMIRSGIKKMYKGKLPTPVMCDPFVGLIYYNKNGRVIKVKENETERARRRAKQLQEEREFWAELEA